MRIVCWLVATAVLLSGDAFAQGPPGAAIPPTSASLVPAEAGRAVSTAFLLDLTNPDRTRAAYRVGVVLADAGIGMLLSPKGSSPRVEYIAGTGQGNPVTSRVLVAAAIDQVRNPSAREFRFHVVRKVLTPQNCSQLSAAVADVYSGLETALSAPVDLTRPAPTPLAIVSDAGDFRIQVMVQSATLTIGRMGENDHPLTGALGQLLRVVVGCSEGVNASAEEDYSYSYQQAIVR